MTRLRQRRTRERRGLTADERSDLGHPATSRPSPFASEVERRAAWERHRESIMAAHQPGSRPEGWWLYESGAPAPLLVPCPVYGDYLIRPEAEWPAAQAERRDRHDRSLSFLAFAGELSPAEINAIRDGRDGVRRLALIAKASARD